jgi:hypothetical protein
LNPRIDDEGFSMGKETRGRYFSEHFDFSLLIDIPAIFHAHILSETGTVIQFEAAVPSDPFIQLVR